MKLLVLLSVALSVACVSATDRVSVVLLGATGNLAEKYLWQGLFNIYSSGLRTGAVPFVYPSATKSTEQASPILSKILANNITDSSKKADFLSRVSSYVQLREESQYEELGKRIESDVSASTEREVGRLFYLSVPPQFFGKIAKFIHQYLRPKTKGAWLRVIVEKPFGVDLTSAEALADELYTSLKQEEILLVDHYMGKAGLHGIREFGKLNPLAQYVANKEIAAVEVGMLETEDCKGRTGFYNDVGVIRDTMQNHLMMMLALVDIDYSLTHGKEPTVEAQVRKQVFESLQRLSLDNVVLLGQYNDYNQHVNEDRRRWNEKELDVPSKTPTYAHVVLNTTNKNSKLFQVPIHLKSGKALNLRRSYVDIVFTDGSYLIFNLQGPSPQGKDGAFVLASSSLGEFKMPQGWKIHHDESTGHFAQAPDTPFAYEVLLRASMEGDTEHFVRLDEVLESWRIWTPLLNSIDKSLEQVQLMFYPHGEGMHLKGGYRDEEEEETKHDEL